ncbi:hypothetical protein JCM10207_003537 [Rhodosporidiobolus poonsookiae]
MHVPAAPVHAFYPHAGAGLAGSICVVLIGYFVKGFGPDMGTDAAVALGSRRLGLAYAIWVATKLFEPANWSSEHARLAVVWLAAIGMNLLMSFCGQDAFIVKARSLYTDLASDRNDVGHAGIRSTPDINSSVCTGWLLAVAPWVSLALASIFYPLLCTLGAAPSTLPVFSSTTGTTAGSAPSSPSRLSSLVNWASSAMAWPFQWVRSFVRPSSPGGAPLLPLAAPAIPSVASASGPLASSSSPAAAALHPSIPLHMSAPLRSSSLPPSSGVPAPSSLTAATAANTPPRIPQPTAVPRVQRVGPRPAAPRVAHPPAPQTPNRPPIPSTGLSRNSPLGAGGSSSKTTARASHETPTRERRSTAAVAASSASATIPHPLSPASYPYTSTDDDADDTNVPNEGFGKKED